ncbi:MAG: nicotinate-nucleotide--dimethylbenzimidazole phosphoribosyltransferase, partial [Desulfobulbaceae bacterium]|nr:nicotinate-nucleotide--dimethylbenzimidazole phosphoribosyltransferase [Desulfobulbaceae bacterium]
MSLLQTTIQQISGQDLAWRQKAKDRLDQLAIPHWSLGRLMDLAMDLAGQTCSLSPPVVRKAVITMAGDHGVAVEGVSKFPQEVTPQMVANFVNGGAGINVLARQAGALVIVVDMGVAADLSALASSGKIIDKKIGFGTANMAKGPAMTRDEAVRSLEAGIEVVMMNRDRFDIFATGDMGIANTTPSSAIA